MVKVKKTYIEALRILAIFLVLFQHVPAFDYYLNEPDLLHEILFIFFDLIAKINVPLFLMISGSLLLTKEERYITIFRKRMIKIIIAILVFNFLVYMAEHDFVVDLTAYIIGVFENGIDRSYWYLYSYLGFLLMLPLLHRICRNMKASDFWIILFIHFVFSTIEPLMQFFVQTFLGQDFEFTWAFRIPFSTVKEIFYPLIGFYIDRILCVEKMQKKWIFTLGLATLAGMMISICFTIVGGNLYGYSDAYFELFDYISAIFAFILIKKLFLSYKDKINISFQNFIVKLGALTYGIYLWDPFFRKMIFDEFEMTLIPYFGGFITSVLWCVFSFVLCGFIVSFLKRALHIQKLF